MTIRSLREFRSILLLLALLPAESLAQVAPIIGDTYLSSTNPALNFGALGNLNVGGGSRALLQFDLSQLPPGTTAAEVAKATLVLYVNRIGVAGSVDVSQVLSAWGEYTATSNLAPSISGGVQ